MTSAADHTREPPQQPPRDYTVIKDLARVFVDVITSADTLAALVSCAIISLVIYFAVGLAASSDCDARGLIAGAKHANAVSMSLTFVCVANIDGEWVEVK